MSGSDIRISEEPPLFRVRPFRVRPHSDSRVAISREYAIQTQHKRTRSIHWIPILVTSILSSLSSSFFPARETTTMVLTHRCFVPYFRRQQILRSPTIFHRGNFAAQLLCEYYMPFVHMPFVTITVVSSIDESTNRELPSYSRISPKTDTIQSIFLWYVRFNLRP